LPVLLIRSDLMRWSLSTYGLLARRLQHAEGRRPQFNNKTIVPKAYDIPILAR
jgi:hypothetical protein